LPGAEVSLWYLCFVSPRSQLLLCVRVAPSAGRHPGAVGPPAGPHHPDLPRGALLRRGRRLLCSDHGPLHEHSVCPGAADRPRRSSAPAACTGSCSLHIFLQEEAPSGLLHHGAERTRGGAERPIIQASGSACVPRVGLSGERRW
uniref:Uncharacterized protein n=1 Tax=Gasterosteus aculeatus TaxID=69293 RepID=G3P360_GASAC